MLGRGLSLFTLASLLHASSSFVLPRQSIRPIYAGAAAARAYRRSSTSVMSTMAPASAENYADPSTGEAAGTRVLEPQGTHHPWYSLQPLKDGGEWASTPAQYMKRMSEESGGAPIFKMHPGLKSVAITDHTSGKWFFSQPETVLDRQDGPYFGSLKCKKEFIGDSLPALTTNKKEFHSDVRNYMMTIIQDRARSVPSAFEHATENFYTNLRANGLGDYPVVYDTMLQHTYAFMLEFMFGTGEEGGQPLPPFEDFRNVNSIDVDLLIKLEIDTPIANLAAQLAQGPGITAEQKASSDVILDSIRSSKMWPKFDKIAQEQQVPRKDLERALMFNSGFQSSVAIAKTMENAIGALSANRELLKQLQKEIDGKDLTFRSVCDEEQFPLLDGLHWEIVRMFPAPRFFVKEAKTDLLVPTNSGDKYQVRKGDMLCCNQDLIQIDPTVFGPDAREFRPQRFIENPELKKEVYKFGYVDSTVKPVPTEGKPWGCVAHATGVLDGILKMFYARWIQEMDWEMTTPTVVDPDQFLGQVGPKAMAFAKVTPRK